MKNYTATTRQLYNKWLRHCRRYRYYALKVKFGMKPTNPHILAAQDELRLLRHAEAMLRTRVPSREWDYQRVVHAGWYETDRYHGMRWLYQRCGFVGGEVALNKWPLRPGQYVATRGQEETD